MPLLGDMISFPDQIWEQATRSSHHLRCDTPTASKQADTADPNLLSRLTISLSTFLHKWFPCREANSISCESLLLAETRRRRKWPKSLSASVVPAIRGLPTSGPLYQFWRLSCALSDCISQTGSWQDKQTARTTPHLHSECVWTRQVEYRSLATLISCLTECTHPTGKQ